MKRFVLAASVLFPPAALADWGEPWGTMVWGQAAALPVPAGPVALLTIGFVLGVYLVTFRGSRAGRTVAVIALIAAPLIALAVTLPHTFVNGTIADADEVNANFNELGFKINASHYELNVDNVFPGQALEVNMLAAALVCRNPGGGGSCSFRLCEEISSQAPPNCEGPFTFSWAFTGSGWRAWKNGVVVTGNDSNNVVQTIHQVGGCRFIDGSGTPLVGLGVVDRGIGFGLQITGAAKQCTLALTD